jgi:phosphoribosylanthranilate isomerase
MTVKICGINNLENLKAVANFQPNYLGFIFYEKSPRFLTLKNLPEFDGIKKVGVFVNANIDVVLEKQKALNLDVIQLHGDESLEYLIKLKSKFDNNIQIFKAISILDENDFKLINHYEDLVDLFILDTKTPLKGGSGKKFDWELLKYYTSDSPFLLSGGIGPDDFKAVNKIYHNNTKMLGVDLNSKFEIEPGLKDVDLIEYFITKLNR